MSVADQIARHTDTTGGPSACWPWTGSVTMAGYGQVRVEGRTRRVHRVVAGAGPEDVVDHTCHNADPTCPGGRACLHRRCVNPDHLDLVTQGENLRRSGRVGKRHTDGRCPQCDLPWTNTGPNGRNYCRPCKNTYQREYRARHKEMTR